MENLALKLIDDEVKDGFVIDNDSKAEWALSKIAEEQKELQRMTMTIDSIMTEYQFKKQQAEKKYDEKTQWITSQLMNYFEKVEGKKATKTKISYSLPTAKLVKKIGGQEFNINDKEIVKWLKESNRNDLVKVKESADWATLKKEVTIKGSSVVTSDGEIVQGVEVIDKPDVFDIEF